MLTLQIYNTLFAPFKVSRSEFSSLLSSSLASVATLHPGECYAGRELGERCISRLQSEIKHLLQV